jgi:hypothetical protein
VTLGGQTGERERDRRQTPTGTGGHGLLNLKSTKGSASKQPHKTQQRQTIVQDEAML